MKYLGLYFDSRWRFDKHFGHLAPKIRCVANCLARLLSNLGGPREQVRRLYVRVMHCHLWADAAVASAVTLGRSTFRVIAIRVIRGYRTISHKTAGVCGYPTLRSPGEDVLDDVPLPSRLAGGEREEIWTDPALTIEESRHQAQRQLFREWKQRLDELNSGCPESCQGCSVFCRRLADDGTDRLTA